MTGTGPQQPTFYTPQEVAEMLRCSAWWVKEQARKRRIPFCWIGGGYRFTAEHLAEIARLFEVRPTAEPGQPATRPAGPVRRRPVTPDDGGTVRLQARVPRRMKLAIDRSTAA
jgi:excisionase family DNA binding protein